MVPSFPAAIIFFDYLFNQERSVITMNIPLALAISPSSWAILCIAVGAIPIGIELSNPNNLVDVDLCDTSRRCLGRILNL